MPVIPVPGRLRQGNQEMGAGELWRDPKGACHANLATQVVLAQSALGAIAGAAISDLRPGIRMHGRGFVVEIGFPERETLQVGPQLRILWGNVELPSLTVTSILSVENLPFAQCVVAGRRCLSESCTCCSPSVWEPGRTAQSVVSLLHKPEYCFSAPQKARPGGTSVTPQHWGGRDVQLCPWRPSA